MERDQGLARAAGWVLRRRDLLGWRVEVPVLLVHQEISVRPPKARHHKEWLPLPLGQLERADLLAVSLLETVHVY